MLEYILNLGNETFELYNEAMRAFFSGDAVSSNDLISRQNELDQKLAACTVGETNPLLACMMCSIRDSLRRVAEYAADIAEITINHLYKPAST
jgi:hypothetical protein